LPNHITVGGTAKCNPRKAWVDTPDTTFGSNWGLRVDIAAPAEGVPIIGYINMPRYNLVSTDPLAHISGWGTSLAAPIVASTAAIMFAIEPTLYAEEVKDYIIDNAYGSNLIQDNLKDVPRLQMAYAVQQLLLDLQTNNAQTLLDPNDLGESDSTGMVVHRTCGGTQIDISGLSEIWLSPTEDSMLTIMNGQLAMVFKGDNNFSCNIVGPINFSLNQSYVWSEELINTFEIFNEDGDEVEISGVSIANSGSITFNRCVITERDGYTNMPMTVEVEGFFNGIYELTAPITDPPEYREFWSYFTMPMITLMSSPSFQSELENLCVGGINHL